MTSTSAPPHSGVFPPWTPEGRNNPFPWYAEMRKAGTVHYHPELKAWGVFGYQEIREVFTDETRFGPAPDSPHGRASQLSSEDRKYGLLVDTLPGLQPPEHTIHRQLFNPFFTPRAIARYRPLVQDAARKLLADLVPQGSFDLVHGFAYALPMLAIAVMLGLPHDLDHFRRFVRGFRGSTIVSGPDGSRPHLNDIELARQTRDDFEEFLEPVLEEHKAHGAGADPICASMNVDLTGITLPRDELVTKSAMMWFGAATHTTQTLITNTILELSRHPDQLQLVREHPELIPSAVEEVLRFHGPVFLIGRPVHRDTELGGVKLRAGERAECWLQAGSRDPAVFPDPDTFDVRRRPGQPNLAFALGRKYCIGAPLARMEGEVALAEWLRATKDFEVVEPEPRDWANSLQVVHLRRLRVNVTPAHDFEPA